MLPLFRKKSAVCFAAGARWHALKVFCVAVLWKAEGDRAGAGGGASGRVSHEDGQVVRRGHRPW